MKIDIITIFPDLFRGLLDYGIVRRAREAGLAEIRVHDLRAFAHDRHRTVDDRPFGGGEGMVLKPEPLFECIEAMHVAPREVRMAGGCGESVLLLSAQGRRFDQRVAHELSLLERVALICGRYEGVDERVAEHLADRELSIGDYVLSGGELAAAVIVDCITRLIPGAVGNEASTRQESFTVGEGASPRLAPKTGARAWGADVNRDGPNSTCASGGLLDYPHYTRPADFRGMQVPEVLVSGNHEEIRRWRRQKALEKTLRNRPDLLETVGLSKEDKQLLAQIRGKDS